MYSEPVRREAMERARDSGLPALSGKVTLVQEFGPEVQAGFLIYLPIYAAGTTPDTVDARRAALLGFVYSPFRAHDIMESIFSGSLNDAALELFDGPRRPTACCSRPRSAVRARATSSTILSRSPAAPGSLA